VTSFRFADLVEGDDVGLIERRGGSCLGTYFSGVTFARKVGTSVTGGVNGNAGSQSVNGFYAINGVLAPEYVDTVMHHDANKSGTVTGTTSGTITTYMRDLPVPMCWPERVG
jgi:hypothetical protein